MGDDDPKFTVEAWVGCVAGLPTQELIRAFEVAFGALCQRAQLTLGPVTLGAVIERVIYIASGVRCESLQKQTSISHGDVAEPIQFVLTEFLTVLGNLSAQSLTPALRAELARDRGIAAGRAIEGLSDLKPSAMKPSATKTPALPRIATGVRNLDALLHGGLPKGSVSVVAGPPGAGKTTLAQQICFHHASATQRVLWFSTLSEPTAKTLFYLSQFSFFDREKTDREEIQSVDLGVILRAEGLDEASRLIMQHVKAFRPALVVIDSFKVFDDFATSREELRKFSYELVVRLMAWEVTAFLLGEYVTSELQSNPMFSMVDGLLLLAHREQSGEQQRFLQIIKMRGTSHSRDEHTFSISPAGIEVFAPTITIQHNPLADQIQTDRLSTGISALDDLLGEGIPRGSSLLVAGASGTGKTVMLLEFLYRGALAGEKGILFSFDETEQRLRATGRGLGWDLNAVTESGMLAIVFIPQPDILVDGDILMIKERIAAMGARRVGIDSVSVFIHKVVEPTRIRAKVFQLATIVQSAGAVGLFATDISYGANWLSRSGIEETVVDGVIVLSATEEDVNRQRYVEVYKLRNTAHVTGRHKMTIGAGGINIAKARRRS